MLLHIFLCEEPGRWLEKDVKTSFSFSYVLRASAWCTNMTSAELLILVNTLRATHMKRWERKYSSGVAASNKRSKPHMTFLCTNTRAAVEMVQRGKF